MPRLVVGTSDNITMTFTGADGETPADCDTLPTVTVVRWDGSATPAPVVTRTAPGRYAVALTAASHLDKVDQLTLTAVGAVSGAAQRQVATVDVAGRRYLSIAQLRDTAGLGDGVKFPSTTLVAALNQFEDLAEQYRGAAFVPRFRHSRFRRIGGGLDFETFQLPDLFPREIRSLTLDDTIIDPSDLRWDRTGLVWRADHACFGVGDEFEVAYEHGFDAPPEPLVRAAVEYVRSTVLGDNSGIPRNVLSESFDGATVRYGTADFGARRPTGWMTVDAALNQVPDYRVPGIS